MLSHHGQVYWITGLAGAGKTTLAKQLYLHLKEFKSNVVFLDGDLLREVLDSSTAFTPEERLKLGMQYSKLCHLLASQGQDVICATISMFERCREWNRANLTHYFEVYLKVSLEELVRRDQKQLYSRAINGEITHVMGVDLSFEEPKKPDLIIENDGKKSPQELFRYILNCSMLKEV